MSKEGEGVIVDGCKCPKCGGNLSYHWFGAAFVKRCTGQNCEYRDMTTSRQNLRKQQQMIWWEDRRKCDD